MEAMIAIPWMRWYRPAWQRLIGQAQDDRLPHALLLIGPPGSARREFAKAFAQAAVCSSPQQDGQACGQCTDCHLSAVGTHPDIHLCCLAEDSRQIKVEQIRGLCHKACLTGSRAPRQIFIVESADRMNANAANALLKTLEEPAGASVFFLIANSLHRLPSTVLSRCQKLHLPPPPADTVLPWLIQAAGVSETVALEALAIAGSPGHALALLDVDAIRHAQGVLDSLFELAEGTVDPVYLAGVWQDEWAGERLRWLGMWVHRLSWQVAGRAAPMPARSSDKAARLTASLDLAALSGYAIRVDRARASLETSLRPELVTETLLIGWCQLAHRRNADTSD